MVYTTSTTRLARWLGNRLPRNVNELTLKFKVWHIKNYSKKILHNFIITFVRHTKLINMLSAYSRNCLTRNSTSFKPCQRPIFMSSIPRHTTRRLSRCY
uniref:SFRICE_018938 n=1 Tax=Spodoptera frugiperda TaxID=7108 RepID=A0A2H1WLC3_SPOFR